MSRDLQDIDTVKIAVGLLVVNVGVLLVLVFGGGVGVLSDAVEEFIVRLLLLTLVVEIIFIIGRR